MWRNRVTWGPSFALRMPLGWPPWWWPMVARIFTTTTRYVPAWGRFFGYPFVLPQLPMCLSWLRDRRFAIFAARVDGAVHYASVDYRGRSALVFGSEAEGLSPTSARRRDHRHRFADVGNRRQSERCRHRRGTLLRSVATTTGRIRVQLDYPVYRVRVPTLRAAANSCS